MLHTPGSSVSISITDWRCLTPANVVFQPVSVVHAMPWRLNAAAIAPPCGVPSFRLPLSSSTARKVRKRRPVEQPFDVQVPDAVQLNAAVEVERDRYQSRSAIAHAEPEPGLGRSRLARSQSASDETYDSQWPSRPHGPR